MFDEINLVVKRDAKAPRKEQIERVKLISFVFLFGVAAVSVIIFFVNLRYSTASIKKQQTQVRQSLTPYTDTAAKIYVLNSRLSDISLILSKRKDYTGTLGNIVSLAKGSSQIKNLAIDSQNQLTLSISSASLSDLNGFLNDVLKLSDTGTIGDVKLVGLKSSEEGYLMGLTIGIR